MAKEFLRKYDNAMIIGKFLPMHKGHKALVEYALKNAHIANVFVLAHQDEYIPMDTRIWFIKDEFAQNQHVNVYGVAYDKNELRDTIRNEIETLLSSDNFTTWDELLSVPKVTVEEPTEEPIEETPVEKPIENKEEIVIPPNENNKEE